VSRAELCGWPLVVVLALGSSGARADATTPVKAAIAAAPDRELVSTMDNWVCLIGKKRDVLCWYSWRGPFRREVVPEHFARMSELADIRSLDAGGETVCALGRSGEVHCWGCQLPPGCTDKPQRIPLERAATQVAVGGLHSCAILDDGEVQCWGFNDVGQLGVRGVDDSTTPRTVPGVSNAVQIAATSNGTCALTADGAVICWGEYLYLTSKRFPPHKIRGLGRAVALESGAALICAITEPRRRVYCWGMRDSGQTWTANDRRLIPSASAPPQRLGKLEHVRKLAMGMYFGCALTETGELYHWGDFSYGGARHFGRAVQKNVTYDIDEGIRPVAHDAPETLPDKRMNVAVARVAQAYDVRDVIVSGHHVCLRLGSGQLRCEWLLSKMPFDIREVWPEVEFDAGRRP
jgi:hypothetical protein